MSLIVVTRSHLENISLYFPNLRFPQKLISEGIPFGPPETMSSLERDHELRLCFFHKRYTTPQVFQLINRNMQGSWPIHNTGDFFGAEIMTQMNTGEFFTTQKAQAYLESEAPDMTKDATLRHSKIMKTPPA